MRTWHWQLPAVAAVIGLFCGGAALAQSEAPSPPGRQETPRIVRGGVYSAEDFVQTSFSQNDPAADENGADGKEKPAPKPKKESPFKEEADQAPMPDEAYESTRETPPKPLPEPRAGAGVCDEAAGCGAGSPCSCHDCCKQRCFGIEFGSWLDQGFTFNARGSQDRFNGPLTFNDRENEYQMNQFYVFAERKTDTCARNWDIGGRIDFLYGTDARFAQAFGLDDRWNSTRFYGAALPQVYVDTAWKDLLVRIGHFYTIIGYEGVMAPGNFFYSHSYTRQYGEPFTNTGILFQYKLGDTLKLSAGVERGWNKWQDNNRQGEFLGGATWTSCDERTSLAFAMTTGAWDDTGLLNRTMYSLVFTRQITDSFKYVLQHDLGIDNDAGIQPPRTTDRRDGQWYSINQYFLYDINCCWSMGLRFEWFRDQDGTRVGGIGDPRGWTLGPDRAANQIGWAGNFYELTAGVNWKPRENILLRPECRWDWYAGPVDGVGNLPYSFGTRSDQFTFAADLIVKY